jgi:hypothetical protein
MAERGGGALLPVSGGSGNGGGKASAPAPPLPRKAKAALLVAFAALLFVIASHGVARSVAPRGGGAHAGLRGRAARRDAAAAALADPTAASLEAARASGAALRFLDASTFGALAALASEAPRKRQAFDFTPDPVRSSLQRLLNVWTPGSYAQPHAHAHDEARGTRGGAGGAGGAGARALHAASGLR